MFEAFFSMTNHETYVVAAYGSALLILTFLTLMTWKSVRQISLQISELENLKVERIRDPDNRRS